MPLAPQFRFMPAMAAVLFGFYAPKLYLRNVADKRAKQIQLGLPDGLDLMVICAEAGLSLDATLVRVSRELANTWPELAEEFGITAAELTFLPERRMAFENLNARTDSEGIRGVVNTLQQTAKFGTPLAQSLRVLAAEMRTARMTRAEEKAARLPALLTIPMMHLHPADAVHRPARPGRDQGDGHFFALTQSWSMAARMWGREKARFPLQP